MAKPWKFNIVTKLPTGIDDDEEEEREERDLDFELDDIDHDPIDAVGQNGLGEWRRDLIAGDLPALFDQVDPLGSLERPFAAKYLMHSN